MGICAEEGCGSPAKVKGKCRLHYGNDHRRAKAAAARAAKPNLICVVCGTEYRPVRYRSVMKFCSLLCKSRARAGDPKHKATLLRCYYKRVYDLSMEQAEEMRRTGCSICGITEDQLVSGRWRRLHIDHDHITGNVRGALCHNCNTGLGQFRHDPTRLRTAAAYLETVQHVP